MDMDVYKAMAMQGSKKKVLGNLVELTHDLCEAYNELEDRVYDLELMHKTPDVVVKVPTAQVPSEIKPSEHCFENFADIDDVAQDDKLGMYVQHGTLMRAMGYSEDGKEGYFGLAVGITADGPCYVTKDMKIVPTETGMPLFVGDDHGPTGMYVSSNVTKEGAILARNFLNKVIDEFDEPLTTKVYPVDSSKPLSPEVKAILQIAAQKAAQKIADQEEFPFG